MIAKMPHTMKSLSRTLCLALAFSFTASAAHAAPDLTTIVVPGGPGGTPDIMARQIAEAMTKVTGKSVIVDNKPGAGGSIGGRFVTKAKADGATLLLTSSGITGTTSHMYPDYQPVEKLDHLALLVSVPFVVVARKNFPAATPKEFIEYVKKHPNQVNWSNAGSGTHGHLTQVMLERASGLRFQIVPYKGSMPAFNDILGGHLDAALDNVATYKASIEAGKVMPIFVTSKERIPALPNVPTARELGIAFDNVAWYALAAPKNSPRVVQDEIRTALQKHFDTEAMRAKYQDMGMSLAVSSQDEAQQKAAADTAAFGKIIKEMNLTAQ
jgi:tripartite-type tricarboxylate transporter receptor subunit TctC